MKDKTALSAPVIPAQPPAIPPPISAPVTADAPETKVIPSLALSASQFAFGEAKSVLAVSRDVIRFQVDHTLRQRKIYSWLWTNPSNAADYFVNCEIQLFRFGNKVGFFPLSEAISAAANSIVPETQVAILAANATPVRDSIAIFPVNPTGTQPNSLVLQPQCVWADIDEIAIAVLSMRNMTGIRLWLGCISSRAEHQ